MCGLVSVYNQQQTVSKQELMQATAALSHRGPDHRAVWCSEHGKIGLGHARLSVVDLTSGDQPIHNPVTGYCIVANRKLLLNKQVSM